MRLNKYLTEIKMTKQTEFYGTTMRWGDEWETKFKVGEWEYEVLFTNWPPEWSMVFKLTDRSLWKLGEFGGGTGFDYSLTKLGKEILYKYFVVSFKHLKNGTKMLDTQPKCSHSQQKMTPMYRAPKKLNNA
jgi:hypothetical protein